MTRQLGRRSATDGGQRRQFWIVYRSTVPPGTTEGVLLPLLAEAAGEGRAVHEVAFNPEFLRQGQRRRRLPAAGAGSSSVSAGPGASRRLGASTITPTAPLLEVLLAVAELAKLVDNGWHALKVAFANEVDGSPRPASTRGR